MEHQNTVIKPSGGLGAGDWVQETTEEQAGDGGKQSPSQKKPNIQTHEENCARKGSQQN